MRVASLNRLSQTRTVTLNGTPFTIESDGVFVNNKTGTSSCGQGSLLGRLRPDHLDRHLAESSAAASRRYIQSIVAPPTGSLDPEATAP